MSTSQPPRKGPIRLEIPDHPDHAPIAAPRSSSAKLASTIARLAGTSSAAHDPCRIRAAISTLPAGRNRAEQRGGGESEQAAVEDASDARRGRRASRP